MKEGTDQRILAKLASMSDLVDLGGVLGVTSLGSALHNGWLVETANGFEKAGEALPPKAVRKAPVKTAVEAADADAEADQADHTPSPTQSDKPARAYLDHASEAYLRDIEQQASPDLYAAAEAFLTNGEEIPDHIMSQVAAKLTGGDKTAAQQVVAQAVQPFYAQASRVVEQAVGPGMAEQVFEFGRSSKQGQEMLRQAMQLQANERSTAGYTKLARAYLADLATKEPQAVVDGINRSGTARATVKSGKVLVKLPDGTDGEFSSLMRSGLI
jgi:hypothetical protein